LVADTRFGVVDFGGATSVFGVAFPVRKGRQVGVACTDVTAPFFPIPIQLQCSRLIFARPSPFAAEACHQKNKAMEYRL